MAFANHQRNTGSLSIIFTASGFQVAVWDQRGHGKSFREGTDANVVHVEDFEEYVKIACLWKK